MEKIIATYENGDMVTLNNGNYFEVTADGGRYPVDKHDVEQDVANGLAHFEQTDYWM